MDTNEHKLSCKEDVSYSSPLVFIRGSISLCALCVSVVKILLVAAEGCAKLIRGHREPTGTSNGMRVPPRVVTTPTSLFPPTISP